MNPLLHISPSLNSHKHHVRFKMKNCATEGLLTLTFPGILYDFWKKIEGEKSSVVVFCNQLSATLYYREYVHTTARCI